jgi:gamma-glutamylcyclotransferase
MYYFAYASNLNRKQMQERCPGARPLFPATLHHYELAFTGWSRVQRGATATIRILWGGKVLGGVYEVSDECLRRMDVREGSDYRRLKVTVNNEDGEAFEAQTYIKTGNDKVDKPSPEYLALIQQGYRDWQLV